MHEGKAMTDELVPLADLARRINEIHDETIRSMRTSIEGAIKCGELLIEAKALVAHGEWLPWLEANTEISEDTAGIWMKYARNKGLLLADSEHVRNLTFREADKLIAEHKAAQRPAAAPAKKRKEPETSGEPSRLAELRSLCADGKDYAEAKAIAYADAKRGAIGADEDLGKDFIRRVRAIADQSGRDVNLVALSDELLEKTEFVLSDTAQKKLDAAIRAHQRKLELEFDARVQAACQKWADDMRLPMYEKRLDEIAKMLTWPRNAVMTKSEYNTILRCLHPDGLNSRTEQQLAEAFRLFTHYKLKMVADEEERKKVLSDFPRTREELLARKKPRAKKSTGHGVTTA
jgi:hypothetical protein